MALGTVVLCLRSFMIAPFLFLRRSICTCFIGKDDIGKELEVDPTINEAETNKSLLVIETPVAHKHVLCRRIRL